MNYTRFREVVNGLLATHYGVSLEQAEQQDADKASVLTSAYLRPFEAVNSYALSAGLKRADGRSAPMKRTDEAAVAAKLPALPSRTERFFEEVVGINVEAFDALEIQGVREFHNSADPEDNIIETDNDDPEFFSVYVHQKPTPTDGGTACIGDFDTHAEAVAYAEELAQRYNWPIYDYGKVSPDVPSNLLPGLLSRVALFYAGGEFRDVKCMDDVDNAGDGLFRFVMRELAPGEDCDTHAEAVRRLSRAAQQLEEVIDLLEAEGYVPEEHAFLEGVLPKVARFYEGGEFLHVESNQDVVDCGDSLFRFLVDELSPKEDCHDAEEAIRRLQTAVSQLRDLEERIAEDACEDTPEPA